MGRVALCTESVCVGCVGYVCIWAIREVVVHVRQVCLWECACVHEV